MTTTEHGERARIMQPADQPDYETLTDLTEQQLAALPARFHTPVWSEGVPATFVCAVCWGDCWCTAWPCETARKHGREVFER